MAQDLCRHKGCTCAARRDGFCSDVCAGHGADAEPDDKPCLCGHDECVAPTKFDSFGSVAELAPEGRFLSDYKRDW